MKERSLTVLVAAQRRPEEITVPFDVADVDYLLVNDSSFIKFGYETSRALITGDFDVVLTHQTGVDSLIASVLGAVFFTPVVMRIGGDAWKIHLEKLREFVSRRQVKNTFSRSVLIILNRFTHLLTTGYLTVSNTLAEIVERKSTVDAEYIHTVVLPIKKPDILKQSYNSEKQEKVRIITVTNLDFRGKFEGLKEALVGAEEVLNSKQAEFHIYGGGSFEEELQDHLSTNYKQLYSSNQIKMYGYVDNIGQKYKNGDIFVYYSYNDGYPNVVLEACSAGLPVITNPDHGMKEQIIDGETGYLISIDDTDEFENALEILCDSHELRCELGTAAREHARQTNNPRTIGEQLVDGLKLIVDHQ